MPSAHPSSRVLMLHKSPTYCPRQMSSSSLIFSMEAISMKVNPAFVFILIIATSLAIHTLVHSYPVITLALGRSELGSCHGPHTFSKVSSPVVVGQSDLGLISWPSHLLSKVSSPIVMGRSKLGLILWPAHLLLRCLCSSWNGLILLHRRCFNMALRFSTTMWTIEEITATDYIERESCGILLAILHLNFYV